MTKSFDLSGKTAIITGASRGIGASCAVGLAEAGVDLILFLRSNTSETSLIEEKIKSFGHRYQRVECDLSKGKMEIEKAFKEAERIVIEDWKKEKGFEILVNVAGIQHRAESVMDVNLKSVFLLCQLMGKHMIPHKYGKIINFASLLSFQGGYTVPAYAASKAGISSLTKSLSNEWAIHNININAIAPGYIETEMNTDLIKNPIRSKQILDRIPAGRWGSADDLVGPLLFLASDASRYVNGTTLTVDGGWMDKSKKSTLVPSARNFFGLRAGSGVSQIPWPSKTAESVSINNLGRNGCIYAKLDAVTVVA
ncbi:hypothetical protein DFH28DRAFT_1126149 [Melampsora americana]|nr:hypothetical protein DFH28DRAFT_1126149 [Melampsora americana]